MNNFRRPMGAKLRQRGDTIVEVLIAMSVIGLVLGASFGIANRATQTGRAAQERTEALKIAESQLELLKTHYEANPTDYDLLSSGNTFCIKEGAAAGAEKEPINTADICADTDGEQGRGLYSITVTPNVGSNTRTYEVNVTWTRVNTTSNEPGTVSLFYRVGTL